MVGGPEESDIPANAVYAVPKNVDRAAINDAIFMSVIKETHSKNYDDPIPTNAIIIAASNVQMGKRIPNDDPKKNNRYEYSSMPNSMKDILYAA